MSRREDQLTVKLGKWAQVVRQIAEQRQCTITDALVGLLEEKYPPIEVRKGGNGRLARIEDRLNQMEDLLNELV